MSQLKEHFPKEYGHYVEPFVGGGAVFFSLLPVRAVLIDRNEDLMNFYRVLRDHLDELLEDLDGHENREDYYYAVRALDVQKLSPVERASRFLYLNKCAYNGLFRVNKQGLFNVPFGRYRNPTIKDEGNLRNASRALGCASLIEGDFQLALDYVSPGTFFYLDPPYHPRSGTANFTSYTAEAFTARDQARLAEVFKQLDAHGGLLVLSNSDTPFIRQLYKDYKIDRVYARRAINCRGNRRNQVAELVIRNF